MQCYDLLLCNNFGVEVCIVELFIVWCVVGWLVVYVWYVFWQFGLFFVFGQFGVEFQLVLVLCDDEVVFEKNVFDVFINSGL